MDLTQTAVLLAKISLYDNRSQSVETVEAWAAVLDDVTLAEAEEAVTNHFSESVHAYLMPGDIRTACLVARQLTEQQRRQAIDAKNLQQEAHCLISGCLCTHTEGCYKGWIENPSGKSVAPCRVCRPELRYKLAEEAHENRARGEHSAEPSTMPDDVKKMVFDRTPAEEAALAIPCPVLWCKAAVGRRCTNPPYDRKLIHPSRFEAAGYAYEGAGRAPVG